jgi:cytochrome b6-f complex iron-sulfur subunit
MTRRGRDLDRMVEAILAGRPLPSGRLDADDTEALRAAIELRAARPGADQPDEEYVTDLRRRLNAEAAEAAEAPARARVPRRALLAGAVGAVAAGVIGAVAESALTPESTPKATASGEIVPDDGQWVAVASAASLSGGQPQRFATATTVGFVSDHHGTLAAVSGACTHQGCLLRLNSDAGRLDCPCHRTAFGFDGKLLFNQLASPPAPLPQIQVRRRDGQVEAFLPRQV